MVNMAPSTFHRYFKKLTSVTPIQYQKALRLQEARRLMGSTGLKASSAAYAVGYESAQQFCREYKRVYGHPPAQDIGCLLDA